MQFTFCIRLFSAGVLASLGAAAALAANPRLDKSTCEQLHTEQTKFIESGILADLRRGPEWAKTNLSAERLREVEHYIDLDEQIKFGCREASLTPELSKAAEIAKRLELNSDADPFAPPKKASKKDQKENSKQAKKKVQKPASQEPAAAAKPEKKSAAPKQGNWATHVTKKRSLAKQVLEIPNPQPPKTRSADTGDWAPPSFLFP